MHDLHIKTPYTTEPFMRRNDGAVFNKNPRQMYIDSKRLELSKWGQQLHGITHEATINQLVIKSSKFCGVKETNDIVELALNFEEDLAIMHNGILSAICFCFPSSWIPADRIGQKLSEIHSHVADGKKLVEASQRITEVMADTSIGSFRRHVWTITSNPSLSNYPMYIKPDFKSIKDLYYRLETQTTAAIGDNTSLFFVKVDVVPLEQLWDDMHSRAAITDSINSMSDAILKYKNLEKIKELIIST